MLKTLNSFGRSFLLANSFLLLTGTISLGQSIPPPPPAENSSNEEVYQFQAPSTNSPSSFPAPDNRNSTPATNTLFRVQIYGSSEQLLSLVRRVEPDAFVRDGKNVIQAGLFSDAVNARELVQSLSKQGIQADIVPIAKTQNRSSRESISLASTPREQPQEESREYIPLAVESSSSANAERESKETTRSYYVVIPSDEEEISEMAQAVQKAGVNQGLIQKRDAPRGTHVAVGPFNERAEANHWSDELQTQGFNARVYFGR